MSLKVNTRARPESTLNEQAAMWRFLHDLFRSPNHAQWKWLNRGETSAGWEMLATYCDAPCSRHFPIPVNFDRFEQSYIATFEVGAPNPPCPLTESHWNKRDPVPRILHENILFYKQFGLELRSSANETADHLRHQLEFMHYLCRLESEERTSANADASQQIALGRSEYLDRHLLSWVPKAAGRLAALNQNDWATDWMRLLAACCHASA